MLIERVDEPTPYIPPISPYFPLYLPISPCISQVPSERVGEPTPDELYFTPRPNPSPILALALALPLALAP